MECWGTRGFFYLFVFMQRFERNFQLKSRKAMQDLTLERNLKKTSWSVLDIYFIYFDKLQQKLFYNCKILEKYGLFFKKKTFQSFPFGDQQVTEPLIYRHINTQFFTSATHLTMAMVYLIELISRVYRLHPS